MRDRTLEAMLNSIGVWLKSSLGIGAIAQELRAVKQQGREILSAIEAQDIKFEQLEQNMATKASEYIAQVDAAFIELGQLVSSESVEIQAAIAAAKNGDDAALELAMQSLAEKRAKLGDQIQSMVSTAETPAEPSPVPVVDPTQPLPGIDLPTPAPVETPSVDPELPVDIAPTPEGVGIDGVPAIDAAE